MEVKCMIWDEKFCMVLVLLSGSQEDDGLV